MSPINFRFPRTSDAVLVKKCQKAFKPFAEEYSSAQINFRTAHQTEGLTGGDLIPSERAKAILALDADAIDSIAINLQNGITLVIRRQQNEEYFDQVEIRCGEHSPQAELRTLEVFASFRKQLGGFEPVHAVGHLLGDQVRMFTEAREDTISRLEQVNVRLTEDMQSFRREQERELLERKKSLDTEFQTRREELEASIQTQQEHLTAKEEALQKLQTEIDDRQSRHARRELRKELKNQLLDYSKTFEVTPGTVALRKSVFWTCISLMILFGLAAFGHLFYGLYILGKDSQSLTLIIALAIKQVVLTGAFVGIATFFIRWNNDWFRQHAREEFRLKRLGLDIDRASWVVEMATEWKEIAKGEELPSELLDRLTRNLFTEDELHSGEDNTAADKLASAILGASANATLQTPAGSLSIDRKGLRKLSNDTLN